MLIDVVCVHPRLLVISVWKDSLRLPQPIPAKVNVKMKDEHNTNNIHINENKIMIFNLNMIFRMCGLLQKRKLRHSHWM